MPPAPVAVAAEPPAPTGVINAHCQVVARLRAADARANGYSFAMAQTIYDGTYKDCVAWDLQHGLGVAR